MVVIYASPNKLCFHNYMIRIY